MIGTKNESRDEVDKKIREFLTEDAIIERTKNCKTYFDQEVTPVAAMTDVRKIIERTKCKTLFFR